MKSFQFFAGLLKSVLLMTVSFACAGIGFAQVTASHDVRMRIIGTSRLAVKQSALQATIVGSSTMNSIDMDLQYTSLKGMDQKRMIVSISGAVPSGVSLGIKESGTEKIRNRWSEIGPDSAAYDITNTMGPAAKGIAGNAASSVNLTISSQDIENEAPNSSDSIVIIYTVI
jgi:hypothetical protein